MVLGAKSFGSLRRGHENWHFYCAALTGLAALQAVLGTIDYLSRTCTLQQWTLLELQVTVFKMGVFMPPTGMGHYITLELFRVA